MNKKEIIKNMEEIVKNEGSFNDFYKDLKIWLNSNKIEKENKGDSLEKVESIKSVSKGEYLIFSIDNKTKLNNTPNKLTIEKEIFPSDKMFVENFIGKEMLDDFYFTTGFSIRTTSYKGEKIAIVHYIWSALFSEKICLETYYWMNPHAENLSWEFKSSNGDDRRTEIHSFFGTEIKKTIITLLHMISKKQYTKYKKWKPSGFETKEIIYSHDVKSHKRHFWKDSGKFKIPFMNKEELEERGYGIDELVFRDGELRRDVPYKIINSFTIGEEKEKKEDNRRIILFEKKIFRNEAKLGTILREIFPDELIKHNKTFHKKSSLRLDYNIWNKRIGFEYDGEQHFNKQLYKKLYGDGFEEQCWRDKEKNKLCKKKNITLIRIKYDEPLPCLRQ